MTKKRKILLTALLALVMVMASACSGISEDVKQPANVSIDSNATTANGTADAGTTDAKAETTTTETAPKTEAAAVTIAETVLYDADGVVVTATGYEVGWMGPEVKVLVENNSDKNVLVTAKSVSANGYMVPQTSLYAEVAAGKKSNETMVFMSSDLKQAGIETIAEMQFYIDISDPDTWETVATSDLITLATSAAGLEQPVDDSGDVLYDSNGIRIVCKGLKQDIVWDGTIVFFMENNSKQPIAVHAENVSVNGFMEDSSLWSEMREGMKIIDGLSLLNLSDLKLESIDDVKNIEFNFRIVHSETWDELAVTDTITLNFE